MQANYGINYQIELQRNHHSSCFKQQLEVYKHICLVNQSNYVIT